MNKNNFFDKFLSVLKNTCVLFTVFVFISYIVLLISKRPEFGPGIKAGALVFIYLFILSASNLLWQNKKMTVAAIFGLHFLINITSFIILLILLNTAYSSSAPVFITVAYIVIYMIIAVPFSVRTSKKRQKNDDSNKKYHSVFTSESENTDGNKK